MKDRTTLLSGLGEFEVVEVDRLAADAVRVVIETVAREAAYPECGTLSTRVKDLPLSRVKDLLGVRSAGRAVVAQAPPVVPTFLVSAAFVSGADGGDPAKVDRPKGPWLCSQTQRENVEST